MEERIKKVKDSPSTRAAKSAAAKAAATARKRAANGVAGKHLGGFREFIQEQGVVGLAIGLVLGIQVKAVVDQIVASFINPVLGIVLPGTGSLAEKSFALTIGDKVGDFKYGAFISVLISFLTVAALVYYGVKALRLDKLEKKKA